MTHPSGTVNDTNQPKETPMDYYCDTTGCDTPECACWANFCPQCATETNGDSPCHKCGG